MTFVPFNLYSYQTGLTLEAQPTNGATPPVAIGPALTSGFTEFGAGAYGWNVQPLPAGTLAVEIRERNSSFTFTGVVFSLAEMGLQTPTNGGGAYQYSITVEDDNSSFTLLPGAAVSLTQGATTLQATTNAEGVATFNLGLGSWVLAAYLSGYYYSGATITVAGNGNLTIQLHPIGSILPPPGPNQLTGYIYTQTPGTTIYYAMIVVPPGSGMELNGLTQAHTSDSSGLWAVPLYWGATYTFNSGNGPTNTILIPSSGASFELQNLLSL
jgi:hypothetical protein